MRGNRSTCDYPPPDYEHLLLCDGQTISADDYPELVAALGSNVLPNLNGRVLQGGSTAGEYKEAGLPNITGTTQLRSSSLNGNSLGLVWKQSDGAIYSDPIDNRDDGSRSVQMSDIFEKASLIGINASRSNPIYGASSTVQPPAYTVRYYICYG